ncbi:uncharacterized protein TNCT_441511 [Trichonephila clavata]|uniref:Uncharacterized protein n=1 Tax=Trichonephila clavata TaxID=2740835 RepID=A0A8X6JB40_TRICU|nr:uncharacterized protein TNCT_441511 [Trichonephila clavata]
MSEITAVALAIQRHDIEASHIKGSKLVNADALSRLETKYSYTVSSSQLNENYYRAVKAIRTLVNDDEGRLNITNTTGDKRMVGVKVYYSTFQVDKDSEVASYSWETLVANIGGNLGFFMGLTLVTFIEVIEFLWDVIATIVRKPNDSDRRTSNKIYAHRTG